MCRADIPVIPTEEDKTKKKPQGIMIIWNALRQYVIEAGDLWSFRKVFATYLNNQYAEPYAAACFLVYHTCKDKAFL